MDRRLTRLRPPRVVGRRGAVLFYLGMVDVLIALSLQWPAPAGQQTGPIRFIAHVMPLPWWAGLWAAAAAACLTGAFVHRLDPAAFTVAVAIKALWGCAFLVGWLAGELARGWVTATTWLGLAVVVLFIAGWPEPRE